ncbi:histone-fold-containing protein [Neoconidiobolus thromboides FSU 785]|nr:histone-fold-containing protein [Neoconidiobolus thromboides FSU 785]
METVDFVEDSTLTTLSETMNPAEEKGANKSADTLQDTIGISLDDMLLSKNVAYRIAKEALPENVKFMSDSKIALAQASTVFINYLAACAQDSAMKNKRKQINGEDVLQALSILDFEEFVPFLKEYSEELKESQEAKRMNKME